MDAEDRHRFPIGDSRPHLMSEDCPCDPYVVEGDGETVIYHHSFDHREVVTEAEVYLGYRCKNCFAFINEKGDHIEDPPPYKEYDHPDNIDEM